MAKEGYIFKMFSHCNNHDDSCFDYVAKMAVTLLFQHCQEDSNGIVSCARRQTTFHDTITRGPFITTIEEEFLLKDNLHDKELLVQKTASFYQKKCTNAARLEKFAEKRRRRENETREAKLRSFCTTSSGVIDWSCANMVNSGNWDQ